MEEPLVSIVMPLYGVERYVSEAVHSALAQTMPQFELIVVDDCSPDNSLAIVQSFNDPRIRVLRHERNLGLASARNTGVAQAKGRFIALLDSDDIATPERLALQVDTLERNPHLIGCGGGMHCMDSAGRLFGKPHRAEADPSRIAPTLLFRNCFFVSSMMFRRSVFATLRYRTDFRMAEDYEFMVRTSRLGPLSNVSKVLLHYRIHGTSLTSTKPQLMDECRRRIAIEQLANMGQTPSPSELDAHMLASIPRQDANLQDIDRAMRWLHHLSGVNRVTQAYPSDIFDDVLASSWFEVCTVASRLGPAALGRYLCGKPRGNPRVTADRAFKFVVKTLLHLRGRESSPLETT